MITTPKDVAMAKVTEHSIILDNGTVWPNPNRDPDDMTPEQAQHYLNSVHQAYHHLLTHPIGTVATVKTLRNLRRALVVSRRARC